MRFLYAFSLFFFLLGGPFGCVQPRIAVKPGIDFEAIKSLTLLDSDRQSLRSVTDSLARQLIYRGYSVQINKSTAEKEGDALIEVNVIQFSPDKKYLVQLYDDEDGKSRDVLLVNPIQEIPGRRVYSSPTFLGRGSEDTQILISNATVSISVRLMDIQSREIWWTGAVTYEGLDLDAAVEGAVVSLMKKIPLK